MIVRVSEALSHTVTVWHRVDAKSAGTAHDGWVRTVHEGCMWHEQADGTIDTMTSAKGRTITCQIPCSVFDFGLAQGDVIELGERTGTAPTRSGQWMDVQSVTDATGYAKGSGHLRFASCVQAVGR